MKDLKDLIIESILDGNFESNASNIILWDRHFKDSSVAEKTMADIQKVINKVTPRKKRMLSDKWSIDLYYGFYAMGIGSNHGITIARKGEVYHINWLCKDKTKSEVKCSLHKDLHVITPIYELPEELEWLIDVVKACPKIEK